LTKLVIEIKKKGVLNMQVFGLYDLLSLQKNV